LRRQRFAERLKNDLLYLGFLVFGALVRLLPERFAYAVGRGLGFLAYMVLPGRRRVAEENIRLALGLEEEAAARLARESFASLGLLGAEFLRLAGRPDLVRARVTFVGEENLREALAAGRGVVLFTGHVGNWEICGQALGVAGYRVHPIVQEQANDRFYAVIDRLRREAGLRPITRGFSLREMLKALREGGCVSIMPDQDAGGSGIFVPFFGRPASTPRGIVVVARLSGAPVVPMFIHRQRPGYHVLRFYPPLALKWTANRDEDVRVNLARMNAFLEEVIKERPEEWLWMHKRWRTRPHHEGRGTA